MLDALALRQDKGALRRLSLMDKKIDFSSNDYLGFAKSERLYESVCKKEDRIKLSNGSGGSRLLTGNSKLAETLEDKLAKAHNTEAALIFNSGYDANMGLFSSIANKEDIILYDELVHASIHDGIKLSRATSFPFRHNDTHHLEQRLKAAKGNIIVAVESIYSMDGDAAPLKEMAELCKKCGANLIIDEAHATGIFGKGLVQELKLDDKAFARIHTFGKALGCHGAVVVGSSILRDYLVNYARSFIYTTALPLHSLLTIESAYELLGKSEEEISKLHQNIKYFRGRIKGKTGWSASSSSIQCLIVPGNEQVKKLAQALQANDMDVRPIMSPTVPKGKERLRICLHSYNTFEEIDRLLQIIDKEAK